VRAFVGVVVRIGTTGLYAANSGLVPETGP